MDVLNKRPLEHLIVHNGTHYGGDRRQASHLRSPQPPFASNELVAPLERPHEDRLNHAVRLDRVRKLSKVVLIPYTTGLVGIRSDIIHIDVVERPL